MAHHKVEISTSTIFKTIALILGLWLAYYLLDVLVMLFVVVLLAVAIEPGVARLSKWGIPRVLSVMLVFLAIIAFLGLIVYIVIPPLVVQIAELANNIPFYVDKFTDFSNSYNTKASQQILNTISKSLDKLTSGVIGATVTVFGGLVTTITIATLTFYLLLEERGVRKAIMSVLPSRNREKIAEMGQRIGIKIGHWLRGQLVLMVFMGILIGSCMWAIGAPYSLALGVIAGVLELVPVLGPIIAATVAVALTFAAGSPIWMLIVIVAVFVVIQQIENQVIVPKIMQKAIGVSPIVIIIAVIVGGRLLGLGGAVLAIPLVGIFSVLLQEYLRIVNRDTQ
ncbi:MAG TPA: AI-2E family transporter [bacterium]|jgi:predicted PurR-regulated permease PerM|nr:AI-2E family transporter [bacterium]HOR57391.1 AI-2E family transporter [bacterium]HPL56105.1 AI-2E family transporter [bacterium]HPM27870.1 AI-2E family transporter [bacterium]